VAADRKRSCAQDSAEGYEKPRRVLPTAPVFPLVTHNSERSRGPRHGQGHRADRIAVHVDDLRFEWYRSASSPSGRTIRGMTSFGPRNSLMIRIRLAGNLPPARRNSHCLHDEPKKGAPRIVQVRPGAADMRASSTVWKDAPGGRDTVSRRGRLDRTNGGAAVSGGDPALDRASCSSAEPLREPRRKPCAPRVVYRRPRRSCRPNPARAACSRLDPPHRALRILAVTIQVV